MDREARQVLDNQRLVHTELNTVLKKQVELNDVFLKQFIFTEFYFIG